MQTNSFESSVLKDGSRYFLRRRILDQFPRGKVLNCFTLPGTALAFEDDITWDYAGDVRLLGVEKDLDIYEEALKKIEAQNIPMKLFCENDLDYWGRSPETKLNAVWLDYCAMWTWHQREALYFMLKNGHLSFDQGNPIVAMTVCAAREPDGEELVDEILVDHLAKGGSLDDVDLLEARRLGIPRSINRHIRSLGYTFVPQFVMYYKDSVRAKRSQPMLLFVFEVVSGVTGYNEGKVPFIHSQAWLSKDVSLH